MSTVAQGSEGVQQIGIGMLMEESWFCDWVGDRAVSSIWRTLQTISMKQDQSGQDHVHHQSLFGPDRIKKIVIPTFMNRWPRVCSKETKETLVRIVIKTLEREVCVKRNVFDGADWTITKLARIECHMSQIHFPNSRQDGSECVVSRWMNHTLLSCTFF